MAFKMIILVALFFICFTHIGNCWTTEDMELFDLVENTPQNFYAVLGVDEKASSSDIRKAYRKLSTLYHPDKSTDPNAEEIFRQMAAVADVLRNDERRKQYDLVLKTGLPDWRMPIYYYRQMRKMALLEISVFLFVLATLGQYLFAWSAYWEKKYEIEEVVLSKIRRKAKNQRKGKHNKDEEEALVDAVMATLQKPRYQDLFPIRFFYFMIHLIKSSPSYIASCGEYFRAKKEVNKEESESEEEETPVPRIRIRKVVKPCIPDYTGIPTNDISSGTIQSSEESQNSTEPKEVLKWSLDSLTEHQIYDLKKALKKFPNGTLQRWEKVASYLNCTVNEVVIMIKEMKNQQFTKGIPLSLQGVTGTEKENYGCELYEEKDAATNIEKGSTGMLLVNSKVNSVSQNGSALNNGGNLNGHCEKVWKQEEQQNLEIALKKYPKDTPARWDRISEFVSSKNKDECLERYKILVKQVKKRKDKAL